jgi:hypothetical protein
MLGSAEPEELSTEEEIQGVLDTLASPLVPAVDGEQSGGYVLACAPKVTQTRLRTTAQEG